MLGFLLGAYKISTRLESFNHIICLSCYYPVQDEGSFIYETSQYIHIQQQTCNRIGFLSM